MIELRTIIIVAVLILYVQQSSGSDSPSTLERAHWCRFPNGTHIPYGYTFMNNVCSMCQCTSKHAISCQTFQCMPTYCVDNTMPTRKSGQCCTQCAYEVATNSCVYNGLIFPHGVILKVVANKMQCWCQLGNIECRNDMNSVAQAVNTVANGSTIYIIVIVLCVALICGVLVCCSCTLLFYYYYQRNQQTFQDAYDQYINSAGWQPMNEDEQNVVDPAAEAKRIEAEQSQFANPANDFVPPPYAAFHNSHVPTEGQKQM